MIGPSGAELAEVPTTQMVLLGVITVRGCAP